MSRIEQLLSEIRSIGPEPTHRNALKVHKILDGNKQLFISKIDPDYFQPIARSFESLSEASAKEYGSEGFKQEYKRTFELLSFYSRRFI